MEKINRKKVPKPECLEVNQEKWTKSWIEKNQTKKEFSWNKYQKQRVEKILTPLLSELTESHCSYCDIFKVTKGEIKPSIDHFKPKTLFPELAFAWDNLFLCCYQCQEYKGNKDPQDILKPDDTNYNFDYWFTIKFSTGEIKPNLQREKEEQIIAEKTITLLGLNRDERPRARIRESKKYTNNSNINDFSYRFYLKACK